MKNLIAVFAILFFSCKHVIHLSQKYIIDLNGVESRAGRNIENMSISQYIKDHNNLDDIRPNHRNEVTQYCCVLNENYKGSRKISFLKPDPNYRWYLCKLNMSILENDSLNALSLQEKLEYTKRMEQISLKDKNYIQIVSHLLFKREVFITCSGYVI